MEQSDVMWSALASAAQEMKGKLGSTEDFDLPSITLERVFQDEAFMGVPASPLQLAITRAAQARPLDGVLPREDCVRYFGCEQPDATTRLLRRVVLICGIRGGKSTLSIAQAITACFTIDLSQVPEHEITRYVIVGPDVDRASDTYQKLLGYMRTSPALMRYIDREPTADTLTIKRPDGRLVEVSVVAASMGGRTVRGVWLLGITLEEAASFGSEATGAVVNAEGILRAAETRLLPGAQAWLITSPFGPMGLVYELYKRHFGKNDTATLVVHAPTRALNPTFPQSRIDEIRKEDPDTAAREYDAAWVDADSAFLESALVDAAIRPSPLMLRGAAKFAAMDPATRGNAWTIAVSDYQLLEESTDANAPRPKKVTIAAVQQWVGSKQKPLSPRAVFGEIANFLHPYGVKRICSDGWSIDALTDHAKVHGLILEQFGEGSTEDLKGTDKYASLKTLVMSRLIELPPDQVMRHDLLSIRKKVTANSVTISLPLTADGRHCDYAPSVALAAHLAVNGKTITFEYDAGGSNAAPHGRSSAYDADDDDDDDRQVGNGGMF
jgi:hypothetical protein